MDYDNMPAGLDMDALIAKQIFGAKLNHLPSFEGGGTVSSEGAESWAYCYWCGEVMPNGYLSGECIKAANQHHYSTDISDAWRVVDMFTEISLSRDDCKEGDTPVWCCKLVYGTVVSYSASIEEAICRAALKAHSPKVY